MNRRQDDQIQDWSDLVATAREAEVELAGAAPLVAASRTLDKR